MDATICTITLFNFNGRPADDFFLCHQKRTTHLFLFLQLYTLILRGGPERPMERATKTITVRYAGGDDSSARSEMQVHTQLQEALDAFEERLASATARYTFAPDPRGVPLMVY